MGGFPIWLTVIIYLAIATIVFYVAVTFLDLL
jgi:hypothetical protein